jgi:predicted transport protein
MGSIRIPISGDQGIALTLSQVPDEAKTMFRRGYAVLARLSEEKREAVVKRALECLEEGSMFEAPSELRGATGLDEQDAEAALGAMMLLATGVDVQLAGKVAEDVPSELVKAKVVEASDLPKVEVLFDSLKKRASQIEARVERSQLASRVLPAFRTLRTAVDLRVQSAEKRLAVAVGLIRIGTDEEDKNFQFQASSMHLKRMIKGLQDLQHEMDEVEKLAPIWEKSQG